MSKILKGSGWYWETKGYVENPKKISFQLTIEAEETKSGGVFSGAIKEESSLGDSQINGSLIKRKSRIIGLEFEKVYNDDTKRSCPIYYYLARHEMKVYKGKRYVRFLGGYYFSQVNFIENEFVVVSGKCEIIFPEDKFLFPPDFYYLP